MTDRYLLIVYEVNMPKNNYFTRRKFISKNEYGSLADDISTGIDLDEIPHEVVEKRRFTVPSEYFGTTHFIIIDVKK